MDLAFRPLRQLATTALCALVLQAGAQPAVVDANPARALQALFDRAWEWSAEQFPEFATYRGDARYNDRLADVSPAAQAQRDAQVQRFAAEARAIQAERLSPSERISLEMFIDAQQRQIDAARFPAARGMTLRSLGGPQTQFADLLQLMPVARAEQVEQMLVRMAAVPRRMAQEIGRARASAAAGWVPSRDVLQRVLAQLDAQLAGEAAASPFYQPFSKLGRDIPPATQQALRERGLLAVQQQVLPALRELRGVVQDELLPRAPADGSLRNYPDGAAVYLQAIRQQTTLALTAAEIQAIGQRELARLRGEMAAVMRAVAFDGDFEAFVRHLNTDPRFFHASPEALLNGYRAIAKQLDAEMPRLFAELPRAPYGVQAMPAHLGADSAEYYNGPALDGSRGGSFFANIVGWRKKPIWAMATLVAHETVPGHHMQVARASELRNLPDFRRGGFGYTAFVEGWALYAETLGFELGIYDDPYARFGHLQWQAFRAARLVADTGIHAFGWSRQQTVDYMVGNTGMERGFVESEVDRYTSQPGQALAYMLGKLKFDELRDKSRSRLGARFDIRRFHNAVLDHGAVPLPVLDRVVDDWVAAELQR